MSPLPLLLSKAGHIVALAQITHDAAAPRCSGVGNDPERSATYSISAPDSKIPVSPSAAFMPGIFPNGCTARYSPDFMEARFRVTEENSTPNSLHAHFGVSKKCVSIVW